MDDELVDDEDEEDDDDENRKIKNQSWHAIILWTWHGIGQSGLANDVSKIAFNRHFKFTFFMAELDAE